MRRVIVKEIRVTNGNRVTMGYDVNQGRRQWWVNEVVKARSVRQQQVTPVDNRREAVILFWELHQMVADVWFEDYVSMFRPRHEEGPYGGAFRDERDYWNYIDPALAREAYGY